MKAFDRFVHDQGKLRKIVKELMAEKDSCCAVAFWGTGAEEWITGHNSRIICNLESGCTNPNVIMTLMKNFEVRCHRNLHAKVFIGGGRALVGSANCSANGLGLEGIEQEGWLEAAALLDGESVQAVTAWFEELWGDPTTLPVDAELLHRSKDHWRRRRREKPTLATFLDYQCRPNEEILVGWYVDSDWRPNKDSLSKQGFDYEKTPGLLDEGTQVIADIEELTVVNRWHLWWRMRDDGKPDHRAKPQFVFHDRVVRQAFRYDDEKIWRDAAILSPSPPPQPFDITNDKNFSESFFDVISTKKYELLRDQDINRPFYKDTFHILPRFWDDVRIAYQKLP